MKLLAFLLVSSLSAQVAQKANERYQSPDARKGMVATLTDPSRDARQRPKELVAALGIARLSSIAARIRGPPG